MAAQVVVHPLVARLAEIQARDELTQTEVAARLGIDRSMYSRLLGGKVQPTVRVVRAIARALPELREACASAVFDEPSEAAL